MSFIYWVSVNQSLGIFAAMTGDPTYKPVCTERYRLQRAAGVCVCARTLGKDFIYVDRNTGARLSNYPLKTSVGVGSRDIEEITITDI